MSMAKWKRKIIKQVQPKGDSNYGMEPRKTKLSDKPHFSSRLAKGNKAYFSDK